jgi:hypothetical protein
MHHVNVLRCHECMRCRKAGEALTLKRKPPKAGKPPVAKLDISEEAVQTGCKARHLQRGSAGARAALKEVSMQQ